LLSTESKYRAVSKLWTMRRSMTRSMLVRREKPRLQDKSPGARGLQIFSKPREDLAKAFNRCACALHLHISCILHTIALQHRPRYRLLSLSKYRLRARRNLCMITAQVPCMYPIAKKMSENGKACSFPKQATKNTASCGYKGTCVMIDPLPTYALEILCNW
jgi:hypothetical protein